MSFRAVLHHAEHFFSGGPKITKARMAASKVSLQPVLQEKAGGEASDSHTNSKPSFIPRAVNESSRAHSREAVISRAEACGSHPREIRTMCARFHSVPLLGPRGTHDASSAAPKPVSHCQWRSHRRRGVSNAF